MDRLNTILLAPPKSYELYARSQDCISLFASSRAHALALMYDVVLACQQIPISKQNIEKALLKRESSEDHMPSTLTFTLGICLAVKHIPQVRLQTKSY